MVSGRVRLAAGNIVAVEAITEVEEAILGTRHLAAGLLLVGAHVGVVTAADVVKRERLAGRGALVTLVTGIVSGAGAVTGTAFGTGVVGGEDGGGAGAEEGQPAGAQLLSTQKHHVGRPLFGVDAEHVVDERREKSRTVGSINPI